MPTIIRQDGFSIMIMTNDHRPPHVHIIKDKGRARITLGSDIERPIIIEAFGMSKKDLKKAYKLVLDNHEKLLLAWEQYHEEN